MRSRTAGRSSCSSTGGGEVLIESGLRRPTGQPSLVHAVVAVLFVVRLDVLRIHNLT